MSNIENNQLPARIFFGFFSAIFGGIGLTVLVSLWAAPWNSFGSPPLFFRIFGSFIALAFVAFSAFGIYSAISGQMKSGQSMSDLGASSHTPPKPSGTYQCPNCGAGIGENADVSPSGDVKCEHCSKWYNIHRQA